MHSNLAKILHKTCFVGCGMAPAHGWQWSEENAVTFSSFSPARALDDMVKV